MTKETTKKETKNKFLEVRVTQTQQELFKLIASEHNITLSELVRKSITEYNENQ